MCAMLKLSLLLVAISWDLVDGSESNLPPYIPRCSLSDPKLCMCLVEKANQAIPIVSKGDALYNIPPMLPISYAEAPYDATCLRFVLYNSSCYDWNRLVITDMFVDVNNRDFGFEGVIDKVEIIAQNYTIIEGAMLDIEACGHGKSNITFVGGKIKYNAHLLFYKKGNDVYWDYAYSEADFNVDRAYFYFENLQSEEECDVNAYLNENWEEFFAQVKPAFDSYSNAFVNYLLEPIITLVPFNKIFLP